MSTGAETVKFLAKSEFFDYKVFGALGPRDPGALGHRDPGAQGPWGTGTLGPRDPGAQGPWGTGTLGHRDPGAQGPWGPGAQAQRGKRNSFLHRRVTAATLMGPWGFLI